MRHRSYERVGHVAAMIFLVVAGLLSTAVTPPYRNFDKPVTINIDSGTSSIEIANALEDSGVVSSKWLFLLVRTLKPQTVLMAGEYRFTRPMTASQVFDQIAHGKVNYYRLTIPEGLTRFEIADLLASQDLADRDTFLAVTERSEWVGDLAPKASSLEGFLFPDTYYFTRGTTAIELGEMMVDQFRRVFRKIATERLPGWTPHDVVTLASLIEKETGARSERYLVSSVFHNRLRQNILLQCDPTVIYGLILENRFRGTIYRSDLRDEHPYNTYIHPGLPPGPIANPGREALEAAVHPDQTEYMFFVAHHAEYGRHIFSKTVRAHERAVAEYRRRSK
jgi:UPF0755 protein